MTSGPVCLYPSHWADECRLDNVSQAGFDFSRVFINIVRNTCRYRSPSSGTSGTPGTKRHSAVRRGERARRAACRGGAIVSNGLPTRQAHSVTDASHGLSLSRHAQAYRQLCPARPAPA